MEYFVSDYHFSHFNIINLCGRPFSSLEEMEDTLIQNTNNLVKPNDHLYVLGDFAFSNVEKYKKRINCYNVYLIRGNHDHLKPNEEKMFSWVKDNYLLSLSKDNKNIKIFMHHYACRVWPKSNNENCFHIYGHSHGTLLDDPNSLSFDVGVDNIPNLLYLGEKKPEYYRPISLNELITLMENKKEKRKNLSNNIVL